MNLGDKVMIFPIEIRDFHRYAWRIGTIIGIEPERGTNYIYRIGNIQLNPGDNILLAEHEFEVL